MVNKSPAISVRLCNLTFSLKNPAFGPIQIRALTEVFTAKALQVNLSQETMRLLMKLKNTLASFVICGRTNSPNQTPKDASTFSAGSAE